MTRIRQTGEATIQNRIDGNAVKLSTFIPLKIRKRGVRKVVIRPDGESTRLASRSQHDNPLLVALARAFYWHQLLDEGVVTSGTMSLIWFQRNPLPLDWIEQQRVVAGFDA